MQGNVLFRLVYPWIRLWRRVTARGLYYVNGPEVLPHPLSREEESEAIERLEGGGEAAEEARMLLIERNLRLVAFIARRYESPLPIGATVEDLISI
jgi:RNA polymerase sporulation-specific sigma factor